MKQNNNYRRKLLFLLLFLPFLAFAQETITGTVTSASNNDPLFGANVLVKGTSTGTSTDFDGNFSLNVSGLPVTLIVSSTGSQTTEVEVTSTQSVSISLEEGVSLDEVVLVGNRSKQRTVLNSLVPIDNISIEELKLTGQTTIDNMLTYKVPSFNSSNQTISDATAHFDPADLRGLGPSRTLVLINGKRKNQSALVYINDTPGKGEVGVDLKSIPAAALKRVEVLRDGASAQYGSDAIAGVLNMVLREDVDVTTVGVTSGVTTEGDGFYLDANLNTGFAIGGNGGFLNLTLGYFNQDKTNRAGEPGGDGLFGVIFDDPEILNGTHPWLVENPDMGMTVGQPEINKGDIFYNFGLPVGAGNTEIYSFGGYTYREGKSFALYRTPYWVPDPFNLLHEAGTTYQGFQPTFETKINDNYNTAGVRFDIAEFDVDLSGTYGRNGVDYEVNNSLNPDLEGSSPTSFDVGAYSFSSMLANLDVSRDFGTVVLGFGTEIREEKFVSEAGEPASYAGGGVQSFPGLQPRNALSETRSSVGIYANLDWEATDKLLFGGAVRYEDFSDFGDNTSWKLSGRYLLGDDKGAIRASYGTGFRAPSLHQIYLSNIQTLVSGGTVSNQGTFNNVDLIIRDGLGVPQLTAETSTSLSAGVTFKVTPKFSFSVDGYQVTVDDRVLFSGEIGFKDDTGLVNPETGLVSETDFTNPVEEILIENSITSLKFFVNAVDTKTTGVDVVATYNNIELGNGRLGVSLAANYNETTIEGTINTPALLALYEYDIFNRKEQSRITTSRPQSKVILGMNYSMGSWKFILNNTYFGEVTWQHAVEESYDQTFAGKVLTDLIVNYKFSNKISAFVSANNLFNVYPDVIDTKGDFVTDLGGRFKYPWEVNQFGFSGTIINGGITYKF